MRQRGRPSAAGLEVIAGDFGKRPEPPADTTPEEAAIWRRITASEPLDFFSTGATQELLKAYCRHQATADKVSEVINLFKPEWLKNAEGMSRFHSLCRARDREVRGATTQATKLRLTNQSRYHEEKAYTAGHNVTKRLKPWEA